MGKKEAVLGVVLLVVVLVVGCEQNFAFEGEEINGSIAANKLEKYTALYEKV